MQAKQRRNSFPSSQGQAGVQPFPGKLSSFMGNSSLERPALLLPMSPFHPSPQLLLLSIRLHALGYPFGQLESAVATVSPPNLLCTSTLVLWWSSTRNREGLEFVSVLLSNSKKMPVINTVFVVNAKYCAIQAAVGKVRFIPAMPNTSM